MQLFWAVLFKGGNLNMSPRVLLEVVKPENLDRSFIGNGSWLRDVQNKHDLSEELVENFIARNSDLVHIPSMQTTFPVVSLPKVEHDRIFFKRPIYTEDGRVQYHILDIYGGWREFYRCYPGAFGLFEFNLPGYNADHTAALVYYRGAGGVTNGDGWLNYLEKRATPYFKPTPVVLQWCVKWEVMHYIS